MKRKCDHCHRPATHHSIEVVNHQKIEKHLCDVHADAEGLSLKSADTPINELLTNFVKLHSGEAVEIGVAKSVESTCENCGLSYSAFRENSLLGCPQCYQAFETPLGPLLERAHEGGSHHIGKVPRRAGVAEQRQAQFQRLRRRLDEAVEAEDFELAVDLRDQIKAMEDAR